MSTWMQDFFQFMDGYCQAFDDLPDGAWYSACQEGVDAWDHGNPEHQLTRENGVLSWVVYKARKKDAS